MDKREAYQIVLNDLLDCAMFRGHYDAEHGSQQFMFGVATVVESIAFGCGKYEEVTDAFIQNMIRSEKAVGKR